MPASAVFRSGGVCTERAVAVLAAEGSQDFPVCPGPAAYGYPGGVYGPRTRAALEKKDFTTKGTKRHEGRKV